ncbi:NADP-reducing hydrogenase subunit HndC [Clostridium homopropionicum DSM 5847]|uniref:NADP-reducing hydrogenase subunit HndC n=1 Tax=Clostridium homopropionicum DSM 5847 TaxID=1121318 RepID=A0A0L6ZAI7_9CLOT|nr:NADH-dependent [FeFe] hydrogenase, group A6 [Clostridium homopropionicum]KOA19989.1 NADP-reducing hydrogenase subunit HndC [Clostridium homopropionicum DSM 5847]SFG64078.1 NAD(P)-dependent iron-only hydrogenase catalytic subunit [Clostridium homopropionicum]
MSLVTLTINDKKVKVDSGTTILEAAKLLDINIPTLCHLKLHDNVENNPGSCRVCMVEVVGRKNLAPACSTPVADGMVVKTNSIWAIKSRRTVVELLLSDHPQDCLLCEKNTYCELQKLAADMAIREMKYEGEMSTFPIDRSSHSIVRDLNKCILCRRCETVCNKVQTVSVLSAVDRGFETVISPAFGDNMLDTNCTFCGQCVSVCPTGALTTVINTSKVWDALNNRKKYVIVQTAPAVRAALGEAFGIEAGTAVTGKMVAALKALGFDKVFDTDFAADLTIMEEATELMNRIKNGGRLPMLTSCCPGWINFFEHEFSDLWDIPSSCKSPQQMFGAVAKSYYAEKMHIKPEDIIVVSVMPCLAKKYEAARPEMGNDVDIVITTRELAKMIKEAGISFNDLKDEEFDSILGESTGAAVIFGVTGGVMEAALRTAYEWITEENLDDVDFKVVRGLHGIKEATIKIKDKEIKAAIASGLGNARKLLNKIRNGEANYEIIEIMACPGGCIDGGGQPFIHGNYGILNKRMDAIYEEDKNKPIRKSHENPAIKKIYEEFLGEPNSPLAHKLLHTKYRKS